MRFLLGVFLFISFFLSLGGGWGKAAHAQPYGNEWVDYSQKYLKFKITEEGIYRIDYNTLNNGLSSIGENVSGIDPRNIQLFGRGDELYIHIEGENDGSFDNNDFIEFYAQGNDGWLDSLLYLTPEEQSNPYYSLFNDTATYYLTWNNSVANRRVNEVTDTNFPPASDASPYFFKEEIIMSSSTYRWGENTGGKYDPQYTAGEGWYDGIFDDGNISSRTLNTANAYTGTGAPACSVNTVVAGVSANLHHLQISYGSSSTLAIDDTWTGYKLKKYDFSIPANTLGTSTTNVSYQLVQTGLTQKTAISHLYYKFAHDYDLEGSSTYKLILPENQTSKTYIIASNFSTNNTMHIYNLTDNERVLVVQAGSQIEALIKEGGEKACYITTENAIKSISTLLPASGAGTFTDFGSMNLDSAFIIITHPKLLSAANDYKTYREGLAGGLHNVVVADINELYTQFSYGINKHPLSIRNFCNYLLNTWSTPPQNLFLIGKAISNSTQTQRNNASNHADNLIPTFDWPASDNAFTAGLNGTLYEAAIPTGRLAARNQIELGNYLSKVQDFEIEQKDNYGGDDNHQINSHHWMKNALHFCGGKDQNENNELCGYLKQYQDTIEDDAYGAKVFTFSKTSSQVIQQNVGDSIKTLIDRGVSLLSFFGHSSAGSWDISVDNASTYENYKKYFLILSNGCFSGDIHQTGNASTSEEFVLIADKGAVGFVASTGLGYKGNLHLYSTQFYYNLSKKLYGKSIGKCMQQAAKTTSLANPSNFNTKAHALEMTLHGDPAIVLNTHEKQDYAVKLPIDVSFNPNPVTSDVDSFDIKIVISNIGKAVDEPVPVRITRKYPTGTQTVYDVELPRVYYKDTLSLTLPVDLVNGIGLNQFEVRIDPLNLIDEISEWNNNIVDNEQIEMWITSGDLIPIYPYNYAVIPEINGLVLKASTSDPFASSKQYIFQIDTDDLYDNGKQYTSTSAGGVVQWNIWQTDSAYLKNLPDDSVFFWRTGPYHINPDSVNWRERSFQYRPGKTGWGQDDYYQFKNNDYTNIIYNRPNLSFDFDSASKSLVCDNYGNPQGVDYYKVQYRINGVITEQNICNGYVTPQIFVAVFDPLSLKPWPTADIINGVTVNYPDYDFGNGNNMLEPNSNNCDPYEIEYQYSFRSNNQEQMDSLREMLNNKIPDGHYVLIYSAARVMWSSTSVWNASHFSAFQALGTSDLSTLGDSIPYIFFVKKGDLSTVQEAIGANVDAFITLSASLENSQNYGEAVSTTIGPAANWGSLHWNLEPLSPEPTGIDSVTIHVLDENNQKITSFSTNPDDVLNLSTFVNASVNPYIKLKAEIKDDSLYTSAQYNHWHVLYEKAPEAALNQLKGLHFYTDTLKEGDNVKFAVAIENVSEYNMDSLRVLYWVIDKSGNKNYIPYPKQDSLRAGEVLFDTISFYTKGIEGKNSFWVEVNPKDSLWQIEQYHFNNIGRVDFYVEDDNINPILDVTFDGIHILDGDIVSPKPSIAIQLDDENQYLILNEHADTTNFEVYLTDPEGMEKRIYFNDGNGQQILQYTFAKAPENEFRIEYDPVFEKDGTYKLRVQATDKSGNKSGDIDYSISFEVINKSTITEVLNYPNPFSTSTRFAFTLTGSQIPEIFTIQIMTITGRIVREITAAELGEINIGRNLSEYAWNGNDEFGDPLANGVYLYRVNAKINGESIEHRSTSADGYFHKGFGKMYILK